MEQGAPITGLKLDTESALSYLVFMEVFSHMTLEEMEAEASQLMEKGFH
jgi:hypothetical protein